MIPQLHIHVHVIAKNLILLLFLTGFMKVICHLQGEFVAELMNLLQEMSSGKKEAVKPLRLKVGTTCTCTMYMYMQVFVLMILVLKHTCTTN